MTITTGPTVLDCTFRDGGYYTNWEFSPQVVVAYLTACAAVGIDVVELGYARLDGGAGTGPFGRLPDGLTPETTAALPDGHRLRAAAMVDAAECAPHGAAAAARRVRDMLDASPLPVGMVRVATHYADVATGAGLAAALHDVGFAVCLNLMQVDLAAPDELDACLRAVAPVPLEALYLADSLGSLTPTRVRALVRLALDGQPAAVGLHAHDNLGLALHNSLVALDAGARWVDGTVHGMGRGAGNARTEQVLAALGHDRDHLQPLLDLVVEHFHPLHDEHRWGASGLFAIAGMREVHPSYVQRLETVAGLTASQKLDALRALGNVSASRFSTTVLDRVLDDVGAR